MSHWTGRIAFAFGMLILSVFALVRWAQSCADPGDPFADYSQHPDVPIGRFAEGQLGVVRPTLARSYLVVAYRYASGVPLTKDEQQAAMALWENRGIEAGNIYPDSSGEGAETHKQNHYIQDAQDAADGLKDWLDARAQIVSSAAPQISQQQGLDSYNSYLNCANDAFATAAVTLKSRAGRFGKDHAGVKDWVAAQDAVFANCGGNPEQPILPSGANASLPELLRYDREYQIAAAYMYSNHYDEAVKSFQGVAAEKSSPWRDMAPYLVARTLIRRATLDVPRPDAPKGGYVPVPAFVPEKMRAAADFANKALANQPNGPFALQMQGLLDRAEFRLHPAEQTARLSRMLSKPAPDGRFYDWLCDYTWLLDRRGDVRGDYGQGGSAEEYARQLPDHQKDILTDWIITFQMESSGATEHALQIWRAHRESLTWLLAVLEKTEANAPQVAEILAAAERVAISSPAYTSVLYHRMRLLNGLGKFPEVRKSIDAYLASKPGLTPVAEDYLLNLRLDAANDLNDAVHFLPRQNCSPENREQASHCATSIAEHSAHFLDALPLDVLVDALDNQNLADAEKVKFVRNAWIRAVILGRHDVAQSLDAQAFRAGVYQNPMSSDVVDKLVKEYEAASTPEEKQFAAVFLMQHQYAFGYDMGSVDAWCASPRGFDDAAGYWRETQKPAIPLGPPPFLTEAQRAQAQKEQSTLDHADSQANYYTRVVLEFAEKHPDDPRVPEALSRAVKNTRMNCNNNRTGDLSERAFNLLHKRYPNTTWAKNTKHWFGKNY